MIKLITPTLNRISKIRKNFKSESTRSSISKINKQLFNSFVHAYSVSEHIRVRQREALVLQLKHYTNKKKKHVEYISF